MSTVNSLNTTVNIIITAAVTTNQKYDKINKSSITLRCEFELNVQCLKI